MRHVVWKEAPPLRDPAAGALEMDTREEQEKVADEQDRRAAAFSSRGPVKADGSGRQKIAHKDILETAPPEPDRIAAAEAAREAVRVLADRVRGEGGVIVMPPRGDPGFAHSTPVMSRAWSTATGEICAEL